jgi:hypothetical protein
MKFDTLVLKIINEAQIFDFKDKDNALIKFIEYVKKNPNEKNIPSIETHVFYEIITNSGKGVGSAKSLGYKDEEIKKWKEYFSSPPWNAPGVWSQIDFNPELKTKKEGVTYNYYVTIAKDKNNINKFWKSLGDLYKKVKTISSEKKVPISFKTHKLLDSFVTHNDSIKFYFYDRSLDKDIDNIVKSWISDNALQTGDRTHTFGFDKEGKGSYGEILQNTVANVFADQIRKHPEGTTQQFLEYIKKYLPQVIKNVKVEYK